MYSAANFADRTYEDMRKAGHGRFFSGLTAAIMPVSLLLAIFGQIFYKDWSENRKLKEEQARLVARWNCAIEQGAEPLYIHSGDVPFSTLDSDHDGFFDLCKNPIDPESDYYNNVYEGGRVTKESFPKEYLDINIGGRPSRFKY